MSIKTIFKHTFDILRSKLIIKKIKYEINFYICTLDLLVNYFTSTCYI